MNSTPTSDTEAFTPPPAEVTTNLFVAFHYKGESNGMPKEGFDSRVLRIPKDVKFDGADQLKELADAIAGSFFDAGNRLKDLEIVLVNLIKLPV